MLIIIILDGACNDAKCCTRWYIGASEAPSFTFLCAFSLLSQHKLNILLISVYVAQGHQKFLMR